VAFKERLGDSEKRISALFLFFGCDDMLYLVGELTISDPVLEAAGEINKVTWTVGTENATIIGDFPDAITGGHYLRKWVENKGYYGKLYTIGSNNLQPLTITWNGLTLEKAQQIFSYYMKRKHVIADYREFSGKLARIADMRIKPFWGSDFVGVTVTLVEHPAFRVYRSTDYGESYQQASDRVNNEFYDYGFVYAGQVRYRIQYDPPDSEATFDGIFDYDTQETIRESISGWKRNTENISIVETHIAGGGTGNVSGDFSLDYPIDSLSDILSFSLDGEEIPFYPVFGASTEMGVMSVEVDTSQGEPNGNLKFYIGVGGNTALPIPIEGTIRVEYIPTVIPRNRTLGMQYDLPVTSIAGAMKLSDIFVTNDPTDVNIYDTTQGFKEYRPKPEISVEAVWVYSKDGIQCALKVTLDYPTNAFDLYPTTIITSEHLEGMVGGAVVIRDSLNPFYVFVTYGEHFIEEGVYQELYNFVAWSRNIYGCSLPTYKSGIATLPPPPYYDKWFVELNGAVNTQNSDYTYVNHNNHFEDVYTPPYNRVYPTELKTESVYSPPPGYSELDGGTHTDVLTELKYKNVYAGEVTQESDYSEIHYT